MLYLEMLTVNENFLIFLIVTLIKRALIFIFLYVVLYESYELLLNDLTLQMATSTVVIVLLYDKLITISVILMCFFI